MHDVVNEQTQLAVEIRQSRMFLVNILRKVNELLSLCVLNQSLQLTEANWQSVVFRLNLLLLQETDLQLDLYVKSVKKGDIPVVGQVGQFTKVFLENGDWLGEIDCFCLAIEFPDELFKHFGVFYESYIIFVVRMDVDLSVDDHEHTLEKRVVFVQVEGLDERTFTADLDNHIEFQFHVVLKLGIGVIQKIDEHERVIVAFAEFHLH